MKQLLIIKNNYITTKIKMDKYNHELEWYIDYFDFIMMMKHEENPMFTIDENYMIMQSIKVCMKYMLPLLISTGNNGGLGVSQEEPMLSPDEGTGLLFQKNKHIPHIDVMIAEIESTSVR